MKPSKEEVFADPILGPRVRRALKSPLWNRSGRGASSDRGAWRVEVLKYRPGRRVCLKVSQPSPRARRDARATAWILKVWYNRRGERIAKTLAHLRRHLETEPTHGRLLLPDPLFYDAAAHALVYPFQEGEPMTRTLRGGASRSWIDPLAHALASLHSAPLEGLRTRSAQDELGTLDDLLASGGLPVKLAKSVRALATRLRGTLPTRSGPCAIHRDLYDQQVLAVGGGGLYFLDLDDVALGDPMLDLGNFIAHLGLMKHWQRRPEKLARVRERLARQYARASGTQTASAAPALVWYETAALVRLAILQARRGRSAQSALLAATAQRLLYHGSMPARAPIPNSG